MQFQLRRDEARYDVVGLGEISVDDVIRVDEVPAWGKKAEVSRRERIGGGQVATALVALARLGARTRLLGVVGNDREGKTALAELEKEGVDTGKVEVRGAGATRQATVIVDRHGERTVLASKPANEEGRAPTIVSTRVVSGRIFHTDGTWLTAAAGAARVARVHGCLVSCDLDGYHPHQTDLLLSQVDVCIVSTSFMEEFAGVRTPEQIAAALPSLAAELPAGGVACVTLGAEGSVTCHAGRLVRVPALKPPDPIVDTTACGDTFRAGFLAALLDGADLRGCLRFASACAALKTSDLGRRGCPTRERVETFLKRRK